MPKSPIRSQRAFSLIEILVVVSIAVILMAASAPVFSKIVLGSELNRGGQQLEGVFAKARQLAVTTNKEVRVIFYEIPVNGTPLWRAVQVVAVHETPDGPREVPMDKLVTLPTSITVQPSADYSPLLTVDPLLAGQAQLQDYGLVRYAGFRIRPSGIPGSAVTPETNFVTLVRQEHAGGSELPANYYTVQIDSVTGKVEAYRP